MHAATLLDAFSRLDDPRSARGVRHPFAGMVVLMLLGMLARIREMEVLVRWARFIGTDSASRWALTATNHPAAPPSAARLPSVAWRNFKRPWLSGCKSA